MMDNFLSSIVAFLAGETRLIFAIIFLFAFFYACDRLSKSEKVYRFLVKINSRNAQAHYNLGDFLRELPDRKVEAENEFRQAIALRPNYSWSYYALYYLQAEQRKIVEAEKTLEQMLMSFPDDGITFACQAHHFWRLGLFQEAETAW